MATQLYVNLPVKNLDASVKFSTALGFAFNPRFISDSATCEPDARGLKSRAPCGEIEARHPSNR